MTQSHLVVACALACGLPAVAPSQQPSAAPLRSVVAASAKTPETLGTIRGIRHLPDGRVLVNDPVRRRLLLFDASMTTYTVVIDSTPGKQNSYGRGGAPFIGYLGDSSIFADMTSQSLLILDEKGKIARVTAPPKPQDVYLLSNGSAGVDAQGRLLYRSNIRPPIPTSAPAPGAVQPPYVPPDSAPIVRADWDTGQVDTIAKFKVATGSRSQMLTASDGSRTYKMVVNPLSWMDDWAINSEGKIAIVRGQDYHIDWIGTDGKRSASPKMPYDWRKLTDEDKTAIVDSTRRMNDSMVVAQGGGMRMMSSGPNGTTTTIIPIKYEYVPINEMPDYYPPLRFGAVQADRDGNIWILPYTSAQGKGKGLVYDVVNSKGDLVQRVELPENRSIVGFGRGGIIYMMSPAPVVKEGDRPGSAGFYLERTMVAPGGSIKQ
jgi:hypothetical protein